MPYWDYLNDDNISPVRRLARSLLWEALQGNPVSLEPLPPRQRRMAWTRGQILEAIWAWARQVGRLPRGREWYHAQAHGLPTRQTVMRHFGSIEVLQEALAQYQEAARA